MFWKSVCPKYDVIPALPIPAVPLALFGSESG